MKVVRRASLPLGFQAQGIASGLKKSGKLDLALLYSRYPAQASCLFTSNTMAAAPVLLSRGLVRGHTSFRAIVVNSGNANCFTGPAGLRDARTTVRAAAAALGVGREEVLVASTGIIGKRLAVDTITHALPRLAAGLSRGGIANAKRAVLTTDTFAKEITVRYAHDGVPVTLCGIAKGAGMIAPNMATMLCFIMTDACVTRRALDKALKDSVDESFNCITVDGCMSTNDSVMMLANAAARNGMIDVSSVGYGRFRQALGTVCLELAKMIVQDGEGATKFITITVSRARTKPEALRAALAIANSNLFKTAMYGENPNFGRIAAAVGACRVNAGEDDIRIQVSPLSRKNINVRVSLSTGGESATVYTSDLTPEYVKINAEYS